LGAVQLLAGKRILMSHWGKRLFYILISLAILSTAVWILQRPFCTIQISDHTKSTGNMINWKYLLSCVVTPHVELTGNVPYRMYIHIHDKDGIRSITCTVNGQPKQLDVPPMVPSFEIEFNGYTDPGTYHYRIAVMDGKGYKASSSAIVSIIPPGFSN
jgi:hypothetical protein